MLSQEQLRDVLARAEEIQRQTEVAPSERDLDHLVSAAGEVGLSREAILQAIRERLGERANPPKEGDRVFAKSSDGHFYPARVVSVDGGLLRVRFVRGTEHTLQLHEVRPYVFLPGQKVVCNWPWWGWWTCEVVAYNAEHDTVEVTDGWSERVFPASEVRLNRERSRTEMSLRTRMAAWLVTAAVGGGFLGGLLTWLLSR